MSAAGTISLPAGVRRRLGRRGTVTVRITSGNIPASVRKRSISEDVVERIAAVQLAPRENVMRFLAAEGSMSRK